MNELLNTLPQVPATLINAKQGLLKSLASDRTTQDDILFNYLYSKRLGNNTDVRKTIYEQVPKLTFNDLKQFHAAELSHKPFTYCIVGDEKSLDMQMLSTHGVVKKLTLEEIFGF